MLPHTAAYCLCCVCCLCSDSHVKGLYYTLRCFMMDLWDHAQGECAASSDAALQTQLELTSLQVGGWTVTCRTRLTQQYWTPQHSSSSNNSSAAAAWGLERKSSLQCCQQCRTFCSTGGAVAPIERQPPVKSFQTFTQHA
jgi:hypothetical protein